MFPIYANQIAGSGFNYFLQIVSTPPYNSSTMSTSGPFKLVMNEGKADVLINATALLNQRIHDIMCARTKRGYADVNPTLVDLERTHILYMNAHYKPHAAIGYEYSLVQVQGGQPGFGTPIAFSIPQYGDFFSDMALNIVLAETSATAGVVPPFPNFVGPDDQVTTATSRSSGRQNTTTGVYTKYTHEYVDFSGNVLQPGSVATNFVRYCEYPGTRIADIVKFEVNGNELEQYTYCATLFHQKFRVQPNKLTGWKNLMGQEVPVTAFTDFMSVAGSSNYNATVAGLKDVNTNAVAGAPVNAAITSRKMQQIVHGFQTPKSVQPQLNLLIPLLFWFCTNFRVAVPSVCLPYGHRIVTITLAPQNHILYTAPGNLFLRLITETITSAGVNKGTAAAVDVTNCSITESRMPVLADGSKIDANQKIASANIYVNQLFCNSEIHDLYINRLGFSLIRVFKQQNTPNSDPEARILLNGLRWPVEYISLGFRPKANMSDENLNRHRDWHRLTFCGEEKMDTIARSTSRMSIDPSQAWSSAAFTRTCTSQQVVESLYVPTYVESVRSLYIEAHSVRLYQSTFGKFFNAYLPYTFGGRHLTTPEDAGAYFVNFCLYPGKYNPSGHINLSRAREFHVGYVANIPSSSSGVSLETIAVASCINFLLVADGSAIIRFNT